jgi:hypothetical protein
MPQAFPPLGLEFEPFLYAVLCNEKNGTPLTIISALARTGVDPWAEAARLATLPRATALAVLGRMCPEGGSHVLASANRILGLLPVSDEKAGLMANSGAGSWSSVMPVVLPLLIALTIMSIFWMQSAPARTEQPFIAPTAEAVSP